MKDETNPTTAVNNNAGINKDKFTAVGHKCFMCGKEITEDNRPFSVIAHYNLRSMEGTFYLCSHSYHADLNDLINEKVFKNDDTVLVEINPKFNTNNGITSIITK